MAGVVVGERRLQRRLLAYARGVAPQITILQDAGGGPEVRAGFKHFRQAEAEPRQVLTVDLRQAEIDASSGSDKGPCLGDRVVDRGRRDHDARGAVDADGQRLEPAFDLGHRQQGLRRDGRGALGGESKSGGEAQGHSELPAVIGFDRQASLAPTGMLAGRRLSREAQAYLQTAGRLTAWPGQ